VFTDLTTTGRAEFLDYAPGNGALGHLTRLFAGLDKELDEAAMKPRTLHRVEPFPLGVPVLVNDELVELPAVHARSGDGGEAEHYYVLDDPALPIVLRVTGRSSGRMVRIAFPAAAAPALEARLKAESRVELHGIYFDFGQATLRPESEPVLREIAAVLAGNPSWTLGLEGHTDDVGGDAYNLELSRRRAEAVKAALVERHHAWALALNPAGYGASRPKASNSTLPGRALNRRVELVRQ
jgi:OOP family OmpA-OmpF porin